MLCNDCPRQCNVDRSFQTGFCRCGLLPKICRAAAHFGEEPCISGINGSGAVFFSGCNLKCVFCQNREISRQETGKTLHVRAFADLLRRLQGQGVHNINLVTPSHFTPFCAEALALAKLDIPVVWNSSGYEKAETLRLLEGLVQVYLPDYKYSDPRLAKKLSAAPDYPEQALSAIQEMVRQRPGAVFSPDGLLQSGVLIRHLILPGEIENTRGVIDTVADYFPDSGVLFSLMAQFTPMPGCGINSVVTREENEDCIHYMKLRHLAGYCQELSSSGEAFIPEFDLTGVET